MISLKVSYAGLLTNSIILFYFYDWFWHYATSRKVPNPIPDKVIGYFNYLMLPTNMSPGSTQPLTEMSSRKLPGGEGRPVPKADNPTSVCESIV
jgi:hypothetical protein